MKTRLFQLFALYSHGEGGGAEDLLVLHLVVGQEQRDGGLGEVLEGHPHRSLGLPLAALEASHQGVKGGAVGGGPRLLQTLSRGAGGLLQGGILLLGSLRGHLGSLRLHGRHLLGALVAKAFLLRRLGNVLHTA